MSGRIRYGDYLKTKCLAHTLDFTRFVFKTYNGSKFVVGKHHRIICEALDEVIQGKTNRLIINLAPRFGKTEIAVKSFISYGLCLNPAAKFLHLSYSNDLAIDNSRHIREMLSDETIRTLFDVNIATKNNMKWYTDKGGGLYATSTGGQVTGFGAGKVDAEDEEEQQAFDEFIPYRDSKFAGAIIIDDPIKPEDAQSDNLREKVNLRFESTIRNRVNSRNTPIIIIMQRLHENDLCGYLQGVEPDSWKVVSLPAIQRDEKGEEESLWPHRWSLSELKHFQEVNSFVFETQYMQNPTPLEGLMYREFQTYETLPPLSKGCVKANYTDTADTGADYLCSICADIHRDAIYVTDILYTKKPMEYTEQATAQMICKNETQVCMIESNNGGRAFARNVKRLAREYGNMKTSFWPFTQTKNKQVRIFTRSAEVNNMIVFPANWQTRWPEFYRDVKGYRKEGGNAHDDHADVLTALVEHINEFLGSAVSDEQILRDFL